MHILVVGAAGRTGRLVVERALGREHEVTALLHRAELPLEHPNLTVVRADALDLEAIREAVAGKTGVAVTLGGGGGGGHLHEKAIANVVYAMAERGSTRLSVLSAAGTFARKDPNLGIRFRALIATTMRSTYDDLEAMEMRVMASDLDWTIVRPVGLSDGPPTGHYRVSLDGSIPRKVSRISRADVAAVVLKGLETDTFRRRAVVVAQ